MLGAPLFRLSAVALLGAALCSAPASAQDEDLLAPLVPSKQKTKPPPKKKGEAALTELIIRLPQGMSDAQIFIDGEEWLASAGSIRVSPGAHQVLVKKAGYEDFSQKVIVAAQKRAVVAVTLEPSAGLLYVSVEPQDAQVLLDGEVLANGSISGALLSPGKHELIVRKHGYGEFRQPLVARAGKEYRFTAQLLADRPAIAAPLDRLERARESERLKPMPPAPAARELVEVVEPEQKQAPGRWYVWVGAALGVAVVAGAAVYLAGPGQPFDVDREVCGGHCDAVLNAPAGVISF